MTGYDGFKKILGTKIHVAVNCNPLPVSIIIGPANNHDSTKLDVMENISDCLDDDLLKEIISVYADIYVNFRLYVLVLVLTSLFYL